MAFVPASENVCWHWYFLIHCLGSKTQSDIYMQCFVVEHILSHIENLMCEENFLLNPTQKYSDAQWCPSMSYHYVINSFYLGVYLICGQKEHLFIFIFFFLVAKFRSFFFLGQMCDFYIGSVSSYTVYHRFVRFSNVDGYASEEKNSWQAVYLLLLVKKYCKFLK